MAKNTTEVGLEPEISQFCNFWNHISVERRLPLRLPLGPLANVHPTVIFFRSKYPAL